MTCQKCNETEGKIREMIKYLEEYNARLSFLIERLKSDKYIAERIAIKSEIEFLKSLLESECETKDSR